MCWFHLKNPISWAKIEANQGEEGIGMTQFRSGNQIVNPGAIFHVTGLPFPISRQRASLCLLFFLACYPFQEVYL